MINGIQQIGIGVKDAKEVFNWYRKVLGFDILVFEDESIASLMLRYTDGLPMERYALLAMNMTGGGGLEIWQFKQRIPCPPLQPVILGDLGINAMKIRASDLNEVHASLQRQKDIAVSSMYQCAPNSAFFFCKDPWDNWVQVIEDPYEYCRTKYLTGGVMGALIGVSEMNRSIHFYARVLGYDHIVSDETGIYGEIPEWKEATNRFRKVVLRPGKKKVSGFGALFGPSEIELVQAIDREPKKIFANRLWGDLGYIHLCFDIQGMDAQRELCVLEGYPFTVDSAKSFAMGDASGQFSYIEDPDGTLIELVETHKVPLIKSLGIHINLKNRTSDRPLPKWLVKAMRIHRVSRDLS